MGEGILEFKGTQGPWEVVPVGDRDTNWAIAANGMSLLTLVTEGEVEFAAVYDKHDARLIAAAPELLAVLMEIVATDDAAIAELKSIMGQHMESSDLTVKARAAIAKSLGE